MGGAVRSPLIILLCAQDIEAITATKENDVFDLRDPVTNRQRDTAKLNEVTIKTNTNRLISEFFRKNELIKNIMISSIIYRCMIM